jgi:DNA-nicking Smr family endonuclease
MKSRSLKDLDALRQKLAEQQANEALAAQARAEAQRRARAEKELFVRAIGAVKPLPAQARVVLQAPAPAPEPLQLQRDQQAVLRESLSDEIDISRMIDTDDQLSYLREGMGRDVIRKLRQGDWALQGEIDLHGLRSDEAREALGGFIRHAHRQGWRCVRVVHGKGLGSPGKTPVLKNKVLRWLVQKSEVLAFVQATPSEGGAGALRVLLAPGTAPNALTAVEVAHPISGLKKALLQTVLQGLGQGQLAHGLGHARQPLITLAHPDRKRHVAHAQARVAKALDVV